MTALIEVHYIPSIAYFSAIGQSDEILLEKHEYFVKQSYRNRCSIQTSNGKINLTVPVTAKHGKALITDVRIAYTQKWLNNHWRTIQSAYGKSAFFEHYAEDLHSLLFQKVIFLYDLNHSLLSMCLKWLNWGMPIKETEDYVQLVPDFVLDLRSALNPKELGQCCKIYYPATYNQVFGNTFVENLSLIDLVFCQGPEASKIVQASAIPKMNK